MYLVTLLSQVLYTTVFLFPQEGERHWARNDQTRMDYPDESGKSSIPWNRPAKIISDVRVSDVVDLRLSQTLIYKCTGHL